MSRHEGVSCDSCLKGNFPGRRYKCLTCYDYDLCASCYEAGATTTRHTTEHPMQCILTRTDFELYYGGEALTTEQSQSFTCPFCGKMGYTETALQEHVNADHPDSTVEVVCPICAALPGGDPNLVTEDFAGHLALEHRPTPRDLISFLDEPAGTRHNVRRIPHSTRGIGGSRPRRSNMHFSSAGGISSLSPSGRDAVDPIAELLSQLSVVRRSNPTQGSASAQLQQLQMQLQLERQQVRAARQQLERFPRRQVHATTATAATSGTTSTTVTSLSNHVLAVSNAGGGSATPKTSETAGNSNASAHAQPHSQLMLTKCMDTSLSEAELEALEVERADRSIFTQDALLNTLMANDEEDDKFEAKQAVRERASPMQMPSQSPPQPSSSSSAQASQQSTSSSQSQPPQQPSAVTQSSSSAAAASATPERPKNGQSEQQLHAPSSQQQPSSVAAAACTKQQRAPPQRSSPSADRTVAAAAATPATTTCSSSQQQQIQQQQQQQLQQRTIAQQQPQQPNRIEYVLSSRPHQQPTGGPISVREVLVGSNYAGSDTARRKPICTVDTLTQTTEPPTSH